MNAIFAALYKCFALMILACLSIGMVVPTAAQSTTGLVNPAQAVVGSVDIYLGDRGTYVLPSGNVIVASDFSGRGAVTCLTPSEYAKGNLVIYEYNSVVGANLGDEVGFGGITILQNGNYVISSPKWNGSRGAVTWVDGKTCLPANSTSRGIRVGKTNSLVGTKPYDFVGWKVSALDVSEGHYVVSSPYWDNDTILNVGAVTWMNGTTGRPMGSAKPNVAVSTTNSLHGITDGDLVGFNGVVPLRNGNYVVVSPFWRLGGIINAGAVTWVNGLTALPIGASAVGTAVSTANSVYGTNSGNGYMGDETYSSLNFIAYPLDNGHYVITHPYWDSESTTDVGAVMWGDGTTGTTGTLTPGNSLHGAQNNDQVGTKIVPLSNGHYVVASQHWDRPSGPSNAGALTWVNGFTGIPAEESSRGAAVSVTNSLYWTSANDFTGGSAVTPLSNGNYVVAAPYWNNGAETSAGAVTWVNGETGIPAGEASAGVAVSTANSLHGSATSTDRVGSAVVALTNGHYVVVSPDWHNGTTVAAGAVTWVNGMTGVPANEVSAGVAVSTHNSLHGTSAYDFVGRCDATPLTNGNYVVNSCVWDATIESVTRTNSGAFTLVNGETGVPVAESNAGVPVSLTNSLHGTVSEDGLESTVKALTNGHYVVAAPYWYHNGQDEVGAVIWVNGTTGIPYGETTSGVAISPNNALHGSTSLDYVGSGGIVGLPNGNYVVLSPKWNNSAPQNKGAVTFRNPNHSPNGVVSLSNSLVDNRITTFGDIAPFLSAFPITFTGTTESYEGYVVSLPYWFSNQQFLRGALVFFDGENNPLYNRSFEAKDYSAKVATLWKTASLSGADKRVCDSLNAANGSCFFMFKKRASVVAGKRVLSQTISLTPFAYNNGDVFRVTALFNGLNVTAGAKLVIRLTYTDSTNAQSFVVIPNGTYAYQTLEAMITASKPVKNIRIAIQAGKANGTLRVDSVALDINPATQSSGDANTIREGALALPPVELPDGFRK